MAEFSAASVVLPSVAPASVVLASGQALAVLAALGGATGAAAMAPVSAVTSANTAGGGLKRAAQFGDVFKIRRELFELAGLARTIAWTGTDEQKQQLAETRTKVLEALTEAKKALHRALGES